MSKSCTLYIYIILLMVSLVYIPMDRITNSKIWRIVRLMTNFAYYSSKDAITDLFSKFIIVHEDSFRILIVEIKIKEKNNFAKEYPKMVYCVQGEPVVLPESKC